MLTQEEVVAMAAVVVGEAVLRAYARGELPGCPPPKNPEKPESSEEKKQ